MQNDFENTVCEMIAGNLAPFARASDSSSVQPATKPRFFSLKVLLTQESASEYYLRGIGSMFRD